MGEGDGEGGRASPLCSLGRLATAEWSSAKRSRLESEIGGSFMLWTWMKLLQVREKKTRRERERERKFCSGHRTDTGKRRMRRGWK